VFQGQYLPLSLSKRGVPYIKKRKKNASAKQKKSRTKKKKNQKCGCPILPSLQT
jgi:transposase